MNTPASTTMTTEPDASLIPSFHDFDPTAQQQCIFPTLRRSRCKWACNDTDNTRAQELYAHFTTSDELPDIGSLMDYAKANCCGPKPNGARHQNKIEDCGILLPLAERWQMEILRERLLQQSNEDAIIVSEPASVGTPSALAQSSESLGSGKGSDPRPESTASSPSATRSLPSAASHSSPTLLSVAPDELTGAHRVLRSNRGIHTSQAPPAMLSRFRPHAEEPDKTVALKMCEPLVKRDFKRGRLYIFSRDKDPGFCKIGWTANDVATRLEGWARCGYTPELIYSSESIPNAQRAETLVHYELIDEWRAERSCDGCKKSHQEWFEISKERAVAVAKRWVRVIQLGDLYSFDGRLTPRWEQIVEDATQNDTDITAQFLLAQGRPSPRPELPKVTPVTPQAIATNTLKIAPTATKSPNRYQVKPTVPRYAARVSTGDACAAIKVTPAMVPQDTGSKRTLLAAAVTTITATSTNGAAQGLGAAPSSNGTSCLQQPSTFRPGETCGCSYAAFCFTVPQAYGTRWPARGIPTAGSGSYRTCAASCDRNVYCDVFTYSGRTGRCFHYRSVGAWTVSYGDNQRVVFLSEAERIAAGVLVAYSCSGVCNETYGGGAGGGGGGGAMPVGGGTATAGKGKDGDTPKRYKLE
ncbi:T5orf172 domain-domain-containing protein [Microdochium bolleyi]|uniref:T5orf172 domain-domain-containing protein n=1 Tax=Microdochium bolleyi TaxID=196109 RepID=A0A136IR08_9PEZI|nr:T5orf172 domain-domain-containing protein [Microdochium bolleyi]